MTSCTSQSLPPCGPQIDSATGPHHLCSISASCQPPRYKLLDRFTLDDWHLDSCQKKPWAFWAGIPRLIHCPRDVNTTPINTSMAPALNLTPSNTIWKATAVWVRKHQEHWQRREERLLLLFHDVHFLHIVNIINQIKQKIFEVFRIISFIKHNTF